MTENVLMLMSEKKERKTSAERGQWTKAWFLQNADGRWEVRVRGKINTYIYVNEECGVGRGLNKKPLKVKQTKVIAITSLQQFTNRRRTTTFAQAEQSGK